MDRITTGQRQQGKAKMTKQTARAEAGDIIALVPPMERSSHRSVKSRSGRSVCLYLINELLRLFTANAPNRAHFLVVEEYAIELICCDKHLWTERCGNELRGRR